MADELLEHYSALKEKGATPKDIYTKAKLEGVSRNSLLWLLVKLFSFSLSEAKAVVASVEGPTIGGLPLITSYEELIWILKHELGYCGCSAYEDAIEILRDVLQLAKDRSECRGNDELFLKTSKALEDRLSFEAVPGLATWFLYFLDSKDLIGHGFRATDCWITDKGRRLLDAIQKFYPPMETQESGSEGSQGE